MEFKDDVAKLKKEFKQSWENESPKFNVFTTLRKEHDEVHLHSRFISNLLDPEGLHGLGSYGLREFMNIIGSQFKKDISKNTIVTPNSTNWTEDNKIDILIEGLVNKNKDKGKSAIIIENKIFATDSNHSNRGQLQGYYHFLRKEKKYEPQQIEIYYLTLDRHKPSKESLGKRHEDLEQLSLEDETHNREKTVRLIDYTMIIEWLDKLLPFAKNEDVKYAIRQYKELIVKLTGDVCLHKELTNCVARYENLTLAEIKNVIGEDKLKHVYWHTLDNFFREIQEELGDLVIERPDRPIYEVITDIVHHNKHVNDLYIELANHWRLQFDEHKGENGFPKGFFLAQYDRNDNGEWKKWSDETKLKYVDNSPKYNFWDFSKGDTFQLLYPKRRKKIIKNIVKFVKQELAKV